jgi:hypothetical protein
LNGNPNYTLKAPQIGGRIDILPRYEDEIRSTGGIVSVVDEGLLDGLENYLVKTESGETLRVVVLWPESLMDDEEQRCFILLDWHRTGPEAEGEDGEPGQARVGFLRRVAFGLWDQVRDRPLIVLALLVIATGVVLLLLGHTKLGEAFIDLGVKVFLTLGALMRSVLASAPTILHTVSDWIRPAYFLAGFIA